jgi:hypothetical protein
MSVDLFLLQNYLFKKPFFMKRYTSLLKNLTFFLMMVGSFYSCETKNIFSQQVFEPILPNEQIITFFEEHLPDFSGLRSVCFFVDDKENKCVVINSMDEFRKNFSCSAIKLPAIDFNSYTLIIGQHQMAGSGYSVAEQSMIVTQKEIELNLKVDVPEDSFAVICPAYYWGIYPKVKNSPISVNINYK